MAISGADFYRWLQQQGLLEQYNQQGIPAMQQQVNQTVQPAPPPEPVPSKPISQVVEEMAVHSYEVNNPQPAVVAVGANVSPQVQKAAVASPVNESVAPSASGYWQRTSEGPKPITQAQATPTFNPLGADPQSTASNTLTQGNVTLAKVNPVQEAPKSVDALGLISALNANPVGVISPILNPMAELQARDTSLGGQITGAYIGAFGEVVNQYKGAQNALSNLGVKPLVESPVKSALPYSALSPVNEVPFVPKSPSQEFGRTAFRVGEGLTIAAIAPVFAPVVGVSAGGVIFGEAIGVGMSQVFKSAAPLWDTSAKGGLLTPEEAAFGAAEGGLFSLAGMGAVKLASKGLPKIATPLLGEASREAKFVGVAGRTAINAGLSGGVSMVASGGKVEETAKGAAFGAVFSLGFDVAGYASTKIPMFKLGNVGVELEGGGKASWKGAYLAKGEDASLLAGKWSVPKGAKIKSHGVTGEEAGFVPKSGVESKVTLEVMKRSGYNQEVIKDVTDIRGLMKQTQNTKSKFIDEILPVETQTLSKKGVSTVKDYVLSNDKSVERLYGSFTQKAQVSKEFEYAIGSDIKVTPLKISPNAIEVKQSSIHGIGEFAKENLPINAELPTIVGSKGVNWSDTPNIIAIGNRASKVKFYTLREIKAGEELTISSYKAARVNPKSLSDVGIAVTTRGRISALRTPADIDIQLSIGGVEAEAFAKGLVGKLKLAGEKVRISSEKPTLIEAKAEGGAWRHAVDIHGIGDLAEAVPARAWGFDIAKKPIEIEGLRSQQLSEQGLAKGVSILGFKSDKTLGPVAHRAKDIPDFFQIQKTLLKSKGLSGKSAEFSRLTKRFNVKDVMKEPFNVKQEYAIRPNTLKGEISKGFGGLTGASLSFSKSISKGQTKTKVYDYPSSIPQSKKPSKAIDPSLPSPSIFIPKYKPSNNPLSQENYRPKPSGPYYPVNKPKYPSPYKPGSDSPSITPKPSDPTYPSPYEPKYPSPYKSGYNDWSSPPPSKSGYNDWSSPPPSKPPNNRFTPYSLGGGHGGGRGFDPLRGKWAERKVPVKTFDQMLKTFGMAPSRQTVKSLNNLDNIIKGKSGRKRKR